MPDDFIILSSLPVDHHIRNATLGSAMAECRNLQSKIWRPIRGWKIARNTFNELGECWTRFNEFRIPAKP